MLKRRTQRGSAIAGATVIVILLTGLATALVTITLPINQTSGLYNQHVVLTYAAEAGLEQARYEIAMSDYDDQGNEWLMINSIVDNGDNVYPEAGDVPAITVTVGSSAVEVFVYSLDATNTFYRVVAVATQGDRSITLILDIRARDTFAKYMFFVDADYISFGTSTIRGAVHSNRHINYYYGGAKFYGDVSARDGFNYAAGANTGNTTFYAAANENAEQIKMPSVNEINALRPLATGVYDIHNDNSTYGGNGALNAEIEFLGDQVRITARRKSSGALVNTGIYPAPSNGLIFVQGDVTSIKGKSSSQITIATIGEVSVTDRITYVDADGDPRYLLKQNGVPVADNDTPVGVAWTEANGFTYEENPDFNPAPGTDPVIGILAGQKVEIANSAPYNMEMHAAVFSATKNWSCNLGSVKGNLKVLGSLVSKKRGWRYSGGSGLGYSASGEYIYDEMLLQSPPKHWLAVDKPVFGARWKQASQ